MSKTLGNVSADFVISCRVACCQVSDSCQTRLPHPLMLLPCVRWFKNRNCRPSLVSTFTVFSSFEALLLSPREWIFGSSSCHHPFRSPTNTLYRANGYSSLHGACMGGTYSLEALLPEVANFCYRE